VASGAFHHIGHLLSTRGKHHRLRTLLGSDIGIALIDHQFFRPGNDAARSDNALEFLQQGLVHKEV
jgi:hypothetical protein